MISSDFNLACLILGLHSRKCGRQIPPKTITLTDCEVEGIPGKQKCGTYEVYENRATKAAARSA